MTVLTAAWRSGRVTEIRANDLFLFASKELEREFFGARDVVAESDVGSLYVPLIDQRYQEAIERFRKMILEDWVSDDPAVLRATGAYVRDTKQLFRDGEDPERAYNTYISELARDWAYDVIRECMDLQLKGKVPEGEWRAGQWLVEDTIRRRSGQLEALARLWVEPNLLAGTVSPAFRAYSEGLRARVGIVFENSEAFTKFEADLFSMAEQAVRDRGEQWARGIHPAELPPWFLELQNRVNRAEVIYKEGMEFPLLGLSCEHARACLTQLENGVFQIPDSPQARTRYRQVHETFASYVEAACYSGPIPTQQLPYERVVVFTTKTAVEALEKELDQEWALQAWGILEELAAQKGIQSGTAKLKEAARQEIIDRIGTIAKNPWDGPLTRTPQGNVVPYAGHPIGLQLYTSWIRVLVRAKFYEIKDWVINARERVDVTGFEVTDAYIKSLRDTFHHIYDNDLQHGAKGISDVRYGASIRERYWREFENWLDSLIGTNQFNAVDECKRAITARFQEIVRKAHGAADVARDSTAEALPEAFLRIENSVEQGIIPSEAQNMLMELNFINATIPSDREARRRFEAIYKKLQDFVYLRQGGPSVTPNPTITNEAYQHGFQRFLDDTNYDREVANWLELDWESQRAAWEQHAMQGLTALEGKKGLSQRALLAMQQAVIDDAWATYRTWRKSMVDSARTRLTQLTRMLEGKTATPTDIENATVASKLFHPFLHGEIMRIRNALQKPLAGALAPFSRFTPLKSRSAFDVEEFSKAHLQKLIDNWATKHFDNNISVQPKINGYRLILQIKDGKCRIYMEDASRDFSNTYKSLSKELCSIPGEAILDAEMTEIIDSKVQPRAGLGKYRRQIVDDSDIVVYVHDILYWKDKDLHDEPLSVRLEKLDEFFDAHDKEFKHLKRMPTWTARSEGELLNLIKKADKVSGSEGAMLKDLKSKYLIGKRTTEWAKAKRHSDLHVKVLGKTKTKANDHVYRCGVLYEGEKDVDKDQLESLAGKQYVVLGNTFRTKLKANTGDKLEVSVSEIVEQPGRIGKQYNWMLPTVKDKSERDVDTLRYAKEVGQLLAASVDQPWKVITGLLDRVLAATTKGELTGIKDTLWNILADLNAARLRTYAYNVLQLARGRLGQAAEPMVTTEGVEKLYDVPTVPRVTTDVLLEYEARLNGLRESAQERPSELSAQTKQLLKTLQSMRGLAEGYILTGLNDLITQTQEFLAELGERGAMSLMDIDQELAEMESEAASWERSPTLNTEDDAKRLARRLDTLTRNMGVTRDYFEGRIQRLYTALENYLNPIHDTRWIDSWLDDLEKKLRSTEGADFAAKRDPGAMLDRLETDMRPWQATLYADRIRVMRELIASLRPLGGATALRCLDLGCGENKHAGCIGIDIQPLPGVDKVWNLENGIPFTDDSCKKIYAINFLEHISNPVRIMTEIWRVLEDGGVLIFDVPSTDGPGAWADPTHNSQYNIYTFDFFTDDDLAKSAGIPCRFHPLVIEQTTDPETGSVHVKGKLSAIKGGRSSASSLPMDLLAAAEKPKGLKGMEADLAHPETLWRECFADLRYLGSSAYPRLQEGKTWGDWTKELVIETFAKLINTLRGECKFPLIPPVKDEEGYDSSYWELYRLCEKKGLIQVLPPTKEEKSAWDKERKQILKAAEILDGLYIVKRHADLIASGEKTAIVKAKGFAVEGRRFYLVTDDRVLGEIELDAPEEIDLEQFNERREDHLVTNEERLRWWPNATTLYYYPIATFKQYALERLYRRKQGVQVFQKDVEPVDRLTAAKLTEQGEAPGTDRMDFMASKPSHIPVKGILWTHILGIDEERKDKSLDQLLKTDLRTDKFTIHHDLRLNWGKDYLEGMTLYLGNQGDYTKLIGYQTGKLGCGLKLKQPVVWNIKSELDNRLFPPGEIGNAAGKDTWGKMFLTDEVGLLPSRIRSEPKGKRYFEFVLRFKKHPKLNGLWAISEEAAKEYDLPFMFFKLKTETPFWLRGDKKHEKEIKSLPDWQRPSQEEVDRFLAGSVGGKTVTGAKNEFEGDQSPFENYMLCAKCYSELIKLGDPHESKTYDEAKKKADKAIEIARDVRGGSECEAFGIPIVDRVGAFVDKANRLWRVLKAQATT